jgi:two-component system OmpR family sensor kinase
MTVRHKISLLITAAGFGASLVFSCIILWEMMEQPFRIIDSDLETISQGAVHMVLQNEENFNSNVPAFIGNEGYWLKIYDQDTGQSIYQSHLAQQIEIPEPAPGSSATVSIVIPKKKIDLRQDRRNEVSFRVRSFIISLDGRTFLVCAGRPMERLEEELWDIFIGFASGLAFSVLLLLAASYFVAGFILKPVKIINDQARDITENNLDRRIPVSGDRDEFNALAHTLNLVFDRLQHAFLRQKRLLADASHELKTPLTLMRLSLEEIRSAHNGNPHGLPMEILARQTEQVLRMERLVKNLLDLSSLEIEDTTTKDPVDVSEILASLITDYRYLAEPRNILIQTCFPRQLIVTGNAKKLTRAFSNILDNAIKYNVDGGRVEVTGSLSDAGLTISTTNTGPGVAETETEKVFEQFYRVEQSRSLQHGGSGLGLAIVKRIIELHGGETKFESKQGDWTRVTVCLPWHWETTS